MRFPVPSGVDHKPKSEDTTTEPKVKNKTQTPTPQLILAAVNGKSMQTDSSPCISRARSYLASCSIIPRYPTLLSISGSMLIHVSTRRRKWVLSRTLCIVLERMVVPSSLLLLKRLRSSRLRIGNIGRFGISRSLLLRKRAVMVAWIEYSRKNIVKIVHSYRQRYKDCRIS